MDELEKELRDKERELTIRDKVITDLRLRLPATADRDKVFNKITEATSGTKFEEDYEGKQAVQVAQSTVYSLQVKFITFYLYVISISLPPNNSLPY